MTEERPIHCILLAIYKEVMQISSLIDVAIKFCFDSDKRSQLFGRFCQNELVLKFVLFKLQ